MEHLVNLFNATITNRELQNEKRSSLPNVRCPLQRPRSSHEGKFIKCWHAALSLIDIYNPYTDTITHRMCYFFVRKLFFKVLTGHEVSIFPQNANSTLNKNNTFLFQVKTDFSEFPLFRTHPPVTITVWTKCCVHQHQQQWLTNVFSAVLCDKEKQNYERS